MGTCTQLLDGHVRLQLLAPSLPKASLLPPTKPGTLFFMVMVIITKNPKLYQEAI